MQASEVPRAMAAARSTASSLDLTVDDAIVLHDSNKLTLRLLPCDVLARVAPVAPVALQVALVLRQYRSPGLTSVGFCVATVLVLAPKNSMLVTEVWRVEPLLPRICIALPCPSPRLSPFLMRPCVPWS
jgi:hypothetical protein